MYALSLSITSQRLFVAPVQKIGPVKSLFDQPGQVSAVIDMRMGQDHRIDR